MIVVDRKKRGLIPLSFKSSAFRLSLFIAPIPAVLRLMIFKIGFYCIQNLLNKEYFFFFVYLVTETDSAASCTQLSQAAWTDNRFGDFEFKKAYVNKRFLVFWNVNEDWRPWKNHIRIKLWFILQIKEEDAQISVFPSKLVAGSLGNLSNDISKYKKDQGWWNTIRE